MTTRVPRAILISSAALCIAALSACTTYYRVSDTTTNGKSYYTTHVKRHDSGAVEFKDGKTKAEITLPSSEVKEITKDEYNAGIK